MTNLTDPQPMAEKDEVDWIDRVLLAMPKRRRNMLLLNRREILSYAEIADVYGVSVRTVEREVFLAILRLRYEQEGMRWPCWRRLLDLFAR